MMKRLTFLLAALSGLFVFAGCGQSGPLYVPGNPSTMAIPPSADTANEDSEEEQDSDEAPDSN